MAEFAESNIQGTVPEIEETERLGLLEKKEIKSLIEKRREWEYRLARRYKSKDDFIGYINFEMKLLELLAIRRKQLRYFEKFKEIEGSIQSRVMKRCRFITRYWPHHLDTWAVRIDFARKIGWTAEVTIAYAEQIRHHGNLESVYVSWAKFEVEERDDFDLARKILLSKATLYHPKSLLIKREHFRLELLFVESLRKRLEEGKAITEVIEEKREQVLSCEIVRAVYNDARHRFKRDPQMYVELYKVADKFSFAHDLREEIYRHLGDAFNNTIPLWKLRAYRVAMGVEAPPVTKKKEEGGEAPTVTKKKEEGGEAPTVTKEEEEGGEAPTVTKEEEEGGEAPTVTKEEEEGGEAPTVTKEEEEGGEAPTVTKEEEGGEAPKKLLSGDKLKLTLEVYDAAMQAVRSKFYVVYIDELMAMLYEAWGNSAHMKVIVRKIISLFKSNNDLLQLEDYGIWFYILRLKPGASDLLETLLYKVTKKYPNAAPFQFEKFKLMWTSTISSKAKNKNFTNMKKKVSGADSIEVREYVINNLDQMYPEFASKYILEMFGVRRNRKRQMTELLQGINDYDDIVAKGMRIRYLQWINEHRPIRRSRIFYEEYCKKPPFSSGFHAAMIMGELTKRDGCMKRVRWSFENAVFQFGGSQPALWIAFILFEKTAGDRLEAIKLPNRAECCLESKHCEEFRQLYSMVSEITDKIQKSAKKSAKKPPKNKAKKPAMISLTNTAKNTTEANIWVLGKDPEDQVKPEPANVHIFEEELTLTYTVDKERKNFFSNIRKMNEKATRDEETIAKDNEALDPEDGSVWAKVIEALVGEKVPLEVKNKSDLVEETPQPSNTKSKKNKKQYELSDHLDPGTVERKTNGSADELQKILDTSATLKPEFLQKTQLSPYFVGKAKAKAARKKELVKTKGPGWNNMKAPEMTEELKRDIEILQMRPILDPKKPFKNKDMQVVPKYFEMGKIVDSPVDFYSSRIPKKKRKRTMAEEILHDEEALSYQKRKYNEIIAKKQNMNPKKHSSGEHKAKKMKRN